MLQRGPVAAPPLRQPDAVAAYNETAEHLIHVACNPTTTIASTKFETSSMFPSASSSVGDCSSHSSRCWEELGKHIPIQATSLSTEGAPTIRNRLQPNTFDMMQEMKMEGTREQYPDLVRSEEPGRLVWRPAFNFIGSDYRQYFYEVGYRKNIGYKELAADWKGGSDGSAVAASLPFQETFEGILSCLD